MSFPPPRDFQVRTIEDLRAGFREGHRTQMVMASTGAGKSYIGLFLISEALKKGKRAIFVVDRKTLIEQTSAVADKYGLGDHGVIQADHWRKSDAAFQIASVQTLDKRGWPPADLLVIDEAHSLYKTWTNHVQNTRAAVIGLSATPFSKGLGKLFSNLVNAETMHQLTQSGILVPMRCLVGREVKQVDMTGAETKAGGEWADHAQEERGMRIVGDVVSEWQKHTPGKKTIVFGSTIKHCEALARQFNEAGIWAACFTQKTKDKERAEILDEYRKDDSPLKVLVSVQALSKGFDVPDVECIADCRPLRKSLSEVIQMWGRGLRSHPDKESCTLLDFSGNRLRFAEDFETFFFEGLDKLDDGKKLDKQIRDKDTSEARGCPKCGRVPFSQRCVACGYQKKQAETVPHAPGTLSEYQVGKHRVANKDLWMHCLALSVRKGKTTTAEGWAAHLYKDIAGVWPPSRRASMDEATAFEGEINPAVFNKAKQKAIAYANSKKID